MRYIVQVSKLYDRYHEMDFGYVGKDLDSGEIHYYSMYDKFEKYSPNNVYEFDINNRCTWGILGWHIRHCSYLKNTDGKTLPAEIVSMSEDVLNRHMAYNIEKGFPIDLLNNNSKNLAYRYVSNFNLFGDITFSGRYIPIENVFDIPVNSNEWKRYDDKAKKDVRDILLHESGHLKVSTYDVDVDNKEIKVRTGFYNSVVNVDPVLLDNGDVFLKYIVSKDIKSIERIIEEVINDYDCIQIDRDFIPRYPNVGYILNELCDGKLLMARYYDNGIQVLFQKLLEIIDSRDLIDELLESILDVTYAGEFNREEDNNHMMKVLHKYQEKKKSKK